MLKFTITSLACTAPDALSAVFSPNPQKNRSYPLKNAQKPVHEFCGSAWICIRIRQNSFHTRYLTRETKDHMTRQESAALNMAKFIRAQTLLLLERLDVLNLDNEAGECEKLHEQAESLYRKLSTRLVGGE